MDITKITKPARKVLPLKKCGVVIVAAGSASRMKGIDKAVTPLGGEPVIRRTIRNFQECDAVSQIVIVTREDLILTIRELSVEAENLKTLYLRLQEAGLHKRDLKGCYVLVNGAPVPRNGKFKDGDVVQLLPPVAGG